MSNQMLWVVALLGGGTLFGVFFRMQGGFGPFNLRAVGLVLIATFATLLAVIDSNSLTAVVGILGAIAGYLFGIKDSGK